MVTKPHKGLVRKRRWKEKASRAACTASVHVRLTEKNSPYSDDTLQSISIDPEKGDETGRVQRARHEYNRLFVCSQRHDHPFEFHALCYARFLSVRVIAMLVLRPLQRSSSSMPG
jgi:hypothetical protein